MKRGLLYTAYAVALLVLLYFDKVINYIMSAINHVTSPVTCTGLFLFGIGVTIIMLVESQRQGKEQKPYKNPQVPDIYPLYNDQPTKEDTYGRDLSARLLISKIFSTFNAEKSKGAEGFLVININEAYGYGKTSFLKIMESELQSSHAGEYYLINYRPWLCDSEKAVIRELFTLLSNSLGIAGIRDDIQEYLYLLLLQSEQIAPSEIKPFYALMPRKLKSKTLQELHDDIKDKLKEIEHPIIITIDDVDRLHEKELVSVLKLIRDTADFPNIFYILAADNSYLEVMLKRHGVEQPHKFLQKFFNLNYLLPAHESVPTQRLFVEVRQILNNYGYTQTVINPLMMLIVHLQHLTKVFSNMRDVYRFLNVYTSSLDILRSNKNLERIDPYEFFCLTIIRHLRPNVYKILRDRNDEFLSVVNDHNDECFKLKNNINREGLLRQEQIDYHLDELEYKKDPQNNEKPQKPKPKSEGLTLDAAIQMTEITTDQVVFYLLDILFNDINNRDERSICRSNAYFIYFSGKVESNKLTTVQVINILKMDSRDYDSHLDKLFKEGKARAFIANFDYAYEKADISREDAMKKAYIYLKKKYFYREDIDHEIFGTVENYINSDSQSFTYFLYGLYGKNHNSNLNSHIKEEEKQFEEYCKKDDDLNMLVLAFYEFSQRLSDFCFGREFVNKMLDILADRLISERMEGKTFDQVEESTYDTMCLLRDEFATNRHWAEKFEAFLCKDEAHIQQWLGSIIRFYSTDVFDWNERHKKAVIGEYFNSSEGILDSLKQKFPDCSVTIEELKRLQHLTSLRDQVTKTSKFIQMAREVQQISTGID